MTPADPATRSSQRVAVGRISGPFGVTGELKCDPTSAGRIVFFAGAQLHSASSGESQLVCITSVRSHKGRLLVRIDGVDDAESAASFSGVTLYASRDQIVLSEGEYLDDDLVGCEVVDIGGVAFGCVQSVEHYPSSDMLVLAKGMVPLVRAIVREIDTLAQRIVIDPPEGLLG